MSDQTVELGVIKFLPGNNGGRYPFCNALFIDDDRKAVIDPGSSRHRLKELSEQHHIDSVILSHFHEDHIHCASFFKDSEILIHPADLKGVQSFDGLFELYGVPEDVDIKPFMNFLVNGLKIEELPQAAPLKDQVLDFGSTKAYVIHTPGHTPGHTCLHFPDQGAMFTADIDLDGFGPYYGDGTSSLSDLLASIDVVQEMSPRTLITSHRAGIVTDGIPEKINAYRDIIFKREDKIHDALTEPKSIAGLVKDHLIYGKQIEPANIYTLIEANMIRHHLLRLIANGRVEQLGADLFFQKQ